MRIGLTARQLAPGLVMKTALSSGPKEALSHLALARRVGLDRIEGGLGRLHAAKAEGLAGFFGQVDTRRRRRQPVAAALWLVAMAERRSQELAADRAAAI